MQDFLKDRPVLASQEAKIIAPAPPPGTTGGASPFARIVRDESVVLSSRPAPAGPGKGAAAGAASQAGANHASQVKTVIENGRVTRLIVTCSCGKVTEIACTY